MHLKLDGHALIGGLAPLRRRRQAPRASITACPLTLGKQAEIRCGDLCLHIPVLDRRQWSARVEFDGEVLRTLARIDADDMFMEVCRVDFLAGEIVFAETFGAAAQMLPLAAAPELSAVPDQMIEG